jgi:hypothetical protein
MHLYYENIAEDMYRHWRGQFFNDTSENRNEYTISTGSWNNISQLMQNIKRNIPTSYGRPPRHILAHSAGYKAEEWSKWITLYSMPLLKDKIDEKYLTYWNKFVMAVKICKKWKITREEVETVRKLLVEFYIHYEKYVF